MDTFSNTVIPKSAALSVKAFTNDPSFKDVTKFSVTSIATEIAASNALSQSPPSHSAAFFISSNNTLSDPALVLPATRSYEVMIASSAPADNAKFDAREVTNCSFSASPVGISSMDIPSICALPGIRSWTFSFCKEGAELGSSDDIVGFCEGAIVGDRELSVEGD